MNFCFLYFFLKRNEKNPKQHKPHFLMLEVKQVNFETTKSPFARLAQEVEISMLTLWIWRNVRYHLATNGFEIGSKHKKIQKGKTINNDLKNVLCQRRWHLTNYSHINLSIIT
jgi:hypothetical protein